MAHTRLLVCAVPGSAAALAVLHLHLMRACCAATCVCRDRVLAGVQEHRAGLHCNCATGDATVSALNFRYGEASLGCCLHGGRPLPLANTSPGSKATTPTAACGGSARHCFCARMGLVQVQGGGSKPAPNKRLSMPWGCRMGHITPTHWNSCRIRGTRGESQLRPPSSLLPTPNPNTFFLRWRPALRPGSL